MSFENLERHTQDDACIVCAKALLASFSMYLDAGRFSRDSKIERDRLWQEYKALKAMESQFCRNPLLFRILAKPNIETREERHARIRFTRKIDEAKRAYLNSYLGLQKQKNRESDWAKIGQRLAEKHNFSEPLKKEPGRPVAHRDINITRATAFDAMKFFMRIAQGKEGVSDQTSLEFPLTEEIPKTIRLSDSLVLEIYRAIFKLDFHEVIEFMLGIVEDELSLLGAKNDASLLNSVSRGRTAIRNGEKKFSVAKNHEQIFNKK